MHTELSPIEQVWEVTTMIPIRMGTHTSQQFMDIVLEAMKNDELLRALNT